MTRFVLAGFFLSNLILYLAVSHYRDYLSTNYWLGFPAVALLLALAVIYLKAKFLRAPESKSLRAGGFFINFLLAAEMIERLFEHLLSFRGHAGSIISILWLLATLTIAIYVSIKITAPKRSQQNHKSA